MTFQYLSVEEAIPRRGLRMVVVGKVPSPWGEAAKGILHLKGIDFAAVRLVYDNEALKAWTGNLSGPVAIYDDEPPRSGWRDILELAERLAPTPALLPADPERRARALELAAMFCDPEGLGWHRRLQMVHAGLTQAGGFPSGKVAGYLGQKYGYDPSRAAHDHARVLELLSEFSALLRARRDAGSPYYFDGLSAVDVYSATFMGLFSPLSEAQCEMNPGIRAAFEWLDAPTAAALDPILLKHRDMMYARHLALPLCL